MLHDHPLVLLVDNHADNREMYTEYLEIRGFRVIPCSDSQASIDVAHRLEPDIILLELRMTGMNGIQVLRELRKDPVLAHVPVVALTASVLTRERAAAEAAGFNELLPKPLLPGRPRDRHQPDHRRLAAGRLFSPRVERCPRCRQPAHRRPAIADDHPVRGSALTTGSVASNSFHFSIPVDGTNSVAAGMVVHAMRPSMTIAAYE